MSDPAPPGGARLTQPQVRAFRAVMQYGSITAAARAMGITQPAVSRTIADLEHAVGFALFERHGGRVVPTREAVEFYGEVERMYYGLERLGRVADEIRQFRRATLHLATLPMTAFRILPEVLSAFVRSYSGVRLTHDVHTSARVVELVASRQVELGICQLRGPRPDLRLLASFRTDCVCVMPPDHPLAEADSLTPQMLEGVPMVALTHHAAASEHLRRIFGEAGVVPNIVVESQPSFSACALAASGLGVAIVDPMTPEIFGARLARVPFRPRLPFEFHVVKSADQPLSRAGDILLQLLLQHLASNDRVQRPDHNIKA